MLKQHVEIPFYPQLFDVHDYYHYQMYKLEPMTY